MTGIIVLAGIGIGITAAVNTLLFVFMFDTIIKSGERGPKLSSPYEQSLAIEIVAEGLSFPTSMEFVDGENILVLEKDHGTVRLISSSNGTLEKEPVLKLNVENEAERGLLGVAILKNVLAALGSLRLMFFLQHHLLSTAILCGRLHNPHITFEE